MAHGTLSLQIIFVFITHHFLIDGLPLTPVDQSIQTCINQDVKRQPVIIDTDTDIDDLWAIQYILNVSIGDRNILKSKYLDCN